MRPILASSYLCHWKSKKCVTWVVLLLAFFPWHIGQIYMYFSSHRKFLLNVHQRWAMLSIAIPFSQGRKGYVIAQLCFPFLQKPMLLLATLVSSNSYPVMKVSFKPFFFIFFFISFYLESLLYPYRFSHATSIGFVFFLFWNFWVDSS